MDIYRWQLAQSVRAFDEELLCIVGTLFQCYFRALDFKLWKRFRKFGEFKFPHRFCESLCHCRNFVLACHVSIALVFSARISASLSAYGSNYLVFLLSVCALPTCLNRMCTFSESASTGRAVVIEAVVPSVVVLICFQRPNPQS